MVIGVLFALRAIDEPDRGPDPTAAVVLVSPAALILVNLVRSRSPRA